MVPLFLQISIKCTTTAQAREFLNAYQASYFPYLFVENVYIQAKLIRLPYETMGHSHYMLFSYRFKV